MNVNTIVAAVSLLFGGLAPACAQYEGAGVVSGMNLPVIERSTETGNSAADHGNQGGETAEQEEEQAAAAPEVETPHIPALQAISCGVEKACNMKSDSGKLCQQRFNATRCPCGKVFFKTLKDYALVSNGVAFDGTKHYFLDTSKGALAALKERRAAVNGILKEMIGKEGKAAREKYNKQLEAVGYPIYGLRDSLLLTTNLNHFANRSLNSLQNHLGSPSGPFDAPGIYMVYAKQLGEWQNILEQVNKIDKVSKALLVKPGMAQMQTRFNKNINANKIKEKTAIELDKAYTEYLLDTYETCGLPVKLMYDYFGSVSFRKMKEGESFPPRINKPLSVQLMPQVKFSSY